MTGDPRQNIMQSILQGGNPQQMVQQIMQSNPRVNAIINQMKQSGMTPEQYVRQYAKQNNIDIDQVVKNLKSRGMKF